MIKMPCLFVRKFSQDRNVFALTDTVMMGCEWVMAGEGSASRKWDGTACLFREDRLWKRYDAKLDRTTGEYKRAPEGSFPCSEPDAATGHWPHWTPLAENDKWHWEAFDRQRDGREALFTLRDALVEGGTYELCGPKVNANPEGFGAHMLLRHGAQTVSGLSRTFHALRAYLADRAIEGLVFSHPDGRFAKNPPP
jgi:hypothetical protein